MGAATGIAAVILAVLMSIFRRFFPSKKPEIEKLIEQKRATLIDSTIYHWGFILICPLIGFLAEDQYGLVVVVGSICLSFLLFLRLVKRRREIKEEILALENGEAIYVQEDIKKTAAVASDKALKIADQEHESSMEQKNASSENESSYEKLKFERNQAKNHNEAVEVDGAQAQNKMQDEVPASGIEIQKQEIFENDEQAQNSENELELKGPASIDVESERFEKAQAAIEYVPKVAGAWKQVEDLPDQFRLKFLKSLDADTRQDVEALVLSILSDHERSERPYENPELNNAFEEAKLLGEEAVAEFTRVIDLLGEPEDVSEFLQKLKGKFVAANAKEQLTHAMQADDEKGMLAGLRDLGIRVRTDFNGKKNSEKTTYRVYFNYREHSLFGAAELKVFIKNVVLV